MVAKLVGNFDWAGKFLSRIACIYLRNCRLNQINRQFGESLRFATIFIRIQSSNVSEREK